MSNLIEIAREFSRYPGPRYRQHGEFSGEQFRDELLIPALKRAIAAGDVLTVVLDDVAGYGSSFLEEAFGGLLRSGFTKPDLDGHLNIVARTPRFQHHALRARSYIADEASRSIAHAH